MISDKMIPVLCCPHCKSSGLSARIAEREGSQFIAGALHCDGCDAEYEIRDGVPDLIPREVLSSAQWEIWRDHLAGFEARRSSRNQHPDRFATRITNQSSALQKAFADFAGIRTGAMLDVGCGPGNFRRQVEKHGVTYFGIDPLPLENTREFFFAQALAEFIPFQDETFNDVIVMSALDHFFDLDAFFDEVARVLRPGGRLHIVQSIHDVRGPVSAVKMLTHWIKDYLESEATQSKNSAAPKHMNEFSKSTIHQALSRRFQIIAEGVQSKRWYSPSKLFLTMNVLADSAQQKRSKSHAVLAQ